MPWQETNPVLEQHHFAPDLLLDRLSAREAGGGRGQRVVGLGFDHRPNHYPQGATARSASGN